MAPISLTIDPRTEEIVRVAEYNVNKVWAKWHQEFSTKSSKEILAMVAYQFAKSYYQLLDQATKQEQLLSDFEAELDRLLQIGDYKPDADTPNPR